MSELQDLDAVRVPNATLPKPPKPVSGNKGDWFIAGPLNGPWLGAVGQLNGDHTLHVALAILHAKAFARKNRPIVVDRFHFDRLGVKKDSTRRALQRLQEAGLITYAKNGQKFHVTIIPVESEND